MIIALRLSEQEAQALQRTADREGCSLEDAARTAVLEYTSGWRRERVRLLETILEQDSAVLRRLGSA